MMTDDYKRVTTIAEAAHEHSSQAAQSAIVHAQWINPIQYQTMCGMDTLNLATLSKNRVVSCAACNAALKKERQRRSRDGTARYQERLQAQRDQVEDATAGYEKAPEFGPDMVWVPSAEIDRLLVDTLRMRAVSLRIDGFPTLALELETVAQRLAEHEQIPDDTSVQQAPTDALSDDKYDGPERRMRPRLIDPTPGEEL